MSPTSTALPIGSAPRAHFIHGKSKDEYHAAHEALKADDEIWHALAFAGIQHDGQGRLAEYRHCPSCQSTLARPIAPEQALFLCQTQASLHERSTEALTAALEVLQRAHQPRPKSRRLARVRRCGENQEAAFAPAPTIGVDRA